MSQLARAETLRDCLNSSSLLSSILRGAGAARRIRAGRAIALGSALAWSIGALLFLRADGSVRMQLPRTSSPHAEEHNLALYRWGPTLRASSYHRESYSHHHPMFLVDGRSRPELIEKWTSALPDRKPWVEIVWREPRQLARIVIRHAGWREEAELTTRRYRLACLIDRAGPAPSLEVSDNSDALASHALSCAGARGVRIDFTPNSADEVVRVYEVEAWGR